MKRKIQPASALTASSRRQVTGTKGIIRSMDKKKLAEHLTHQQKMYNNHVSRSLNL
jgi:hypothetical protein